MHRILISFVVLTTLSSSSAFAQSNSYTIWINQQEIFTHHEMDAGDTVDIKKSFFNETDTLTAQYLHVGDLAHGNNSRLTLKNELNQLIRGEGIIQDQAYHKASIPMKEILKHWKLGSYKYLRISIVVHNDGETIAQGYQIGVLRIVD